MMSLSQAEDRLQLACEVCLSGYDPQDHRPLLLPACGHTFCAFCVEHLQRQGNTCCPLCRKNGALQPVSSLPVNYSLLDIAQNNSCGAAAAADDDDDVRPAPSSPHRTTDATGPQPTKLRYRCHKVQRSNSMVTNRTNSTSRTVPAMSSQYLPRRAAVNPSVVRGLTIPTPASAALGAHNPRHSQTVLEREEQDELDFQMAIHLTFCKDASHDHDLHTRCSSWGW